MHSTCIGDTLDKWCITPLVMFNVSMVGFMRSVHVCHGVPTLAATATATKVVREAVIDELDSICVT